MKKNIVTPLYLSAFCLELSTVLSAGIPLSEGLFMLYNDDNDKDSKEIIGELYKKTEEGKSLFEALESSGAFPRYMCDVVELCEKTGDLDNSLLALSKYYERQAFLARRIKSTVFYPLILVFYYDL